LYALGVDDVDIILIEKFPCVDKMELHKRERYWIEKLDCCNKAIPTRTSKEWYKDNKEKIKVKTKAYREANKEKLNAKCKAYREANKEKIKVYNEDNKEKIDSYKKAYREANKEKERARQKAYREANKEKISARRKAYKEANKEKIKKKVTCECGSLVRKDDIAKHKKTKKHKALMEAK
jgi:hypothetical protein